MQTALHFWDGDSEISTKEHTLDMSILSSLFLIPQATQSSLVHLPPWMAYEPLIFLAPLDTSCSGGLS